MTPRIFIFTILTMLFFGCAQSPIENGDHTYFTVTSFTQGKMKNVSGHWSVYEKTDEMEYRENGECILNHERTPCMWHGFILEYDSLGKDIKLDCLLHSNKSHVIVNPNEIIQRNGKEDRITFHLKGSEHIFINPQYISRPPPRGSMVTTTICSVTNEVVLRFTQKFTYSQSSRKNAQHNASN